MAEQDPDYFEEFVIEEEEAETSSNRPFILAAGGLVAILLTALLCLAVYQFFFNGDQEADAVADSAIAITATSISATNEAIETQNAFVTQTLVAMEMTAQAPTSTPTLQPTATPSPPPTATPTATPVVQADEEADGATAEADGAEEGEESAAAPTSIFNDQNTATPEAATAGDVSASNANTAEALPETGISLWGGLAAALGLFFILLVARRLRIGSS